MKNYTALENDKTMDKQLIPKVIHYAWFGRGEKSNLAKKCIESWKIYLPDYTFKEWNEDNFDLDMYPFARHAYDNRKFAYVSDVVRLHALFYEGGIYMDTDVEVIKNMDDLLCLHGFSGFQSPTEIPTGTMAAEPNNHWVKDQLDYYNFNDFVLNDVNEKLITNVELITGMSLEKHGLIPNNQKQELLYGMVMFPLDYFCAKSVSTGKLMITENTYTIHHFAGSWVPASAKRNKKIMRILNSIVGERTANKIYRIIKGKID